MASSTARSRSPPNEKSTTSLLGRLSLSPAKPGTLSKAAVHHASTTSPPPLPRKSRSRMSSSEASHVAAHGGHTMGGPSYETLASYNDPPHQLRDSPRRSATHLASVDGLSHNLDQGYSVAPRFGSSASSTAHNISEPRSPPKSVMHASPPRVRQPIYPALASPPKNRQTPRLSTSTSDVFTASSSPTKAEEPFRPWPDPVTSRSDTFDASSRPKKVASQMPSSSHRASPRGQEAVSAVSPTRSPSNMYVIASSSAKPQAYSPGGTTVSPQPYRHDRNGRPMISARKSAASSSRTITRLDRGGSPPLPSPSLLHATSDVPLQEAVIANGSTEASAYASVMASSFSRSEPGPELRHSQASPEVRNSRGDRPLPRPPGEPIESSRVTSAWPNPSIPQTQQPQRAYRSPTTKPEHARRVINNEGRKLAHGDLGSMHESPNDVRRPMISPARQASVNNNRSVPPGGNQPITIISEPSNAQSGPIRESLPQRAEDRLRAVNGTLLHRKPGALGLDYLVGHPVIQSALLAQLGINAFLSLSGSSEDVRRQFTGESVGRWVLREWAVDAPELVSTRWPNLTVWEGFLESLLHDPATYSTYPVRWHNLLRHLSLSYTLVVLYLRALPSSCFPNHSLLPFEDDSTGGSLPFSASSASLSSLGRPRSRVGSTMGSDAGSVTASKPPRRERVIEIVMPEPLAAQPQTEESPVLVKQNSARRRGSISSLASAASFSFGRRRSNSLATEIRPPHRVSVPLAEPAASMAPGKAALPPVSYPSAKRYGFRNASDVPIRRRTATESRAGSIYSFQTGPSVASYAPRMSHDMRTLGTSDLPLAIPPPIGVRPRSSFGSADSHRRSDIGSPAPGRRLVAHRSEPAFDKPMPYIPGRAPVLRVFVPLSDRVRRWPSAEGAAAAVEELEKCGALKRMRLGDLIVNTAISSPRTTEHVLLFVPFVKHLLVPLQYSHLPTGHLPSYVDAFALPPSYYFPFLPTPQIIFLNLGAYREQGLRSMRLASDRRDMTVSSGARISAKRYLYVAGVEVGPGDKAAPEWHGMVSLEAEGTAEGKAELIRRFGTGPASDAPLAPWEVIKEKSMGGTVWLRAAKPHLSL